METIIYTVRKGDTLSEIARRFNTTVGMIARYNGIVTPDLIYPDQVLRIPVSEIPKIRQDRCPLYASAEYRVREGDTLTELAKRYGVSVQMLSDFNALTDPDTLTVGQMLKIPVMQKDGRYLVRKGDSLYAIAQKFHTTVEALCRQNGIDDPDGLMEGQIILLTAEQEPDASEASDGTYTVQEGDTLWKIAGKNRVTVAALINANRLTKPDCLYPGQVLKIPS